MLYNMSLFRYPNVRFRKQNAFLGKRELSVCILESLVQWTLDCVMQRIFTMFFNYITLLHDICYKTWRFAAREERNLLQCEKQMLFYGPSHRKAHRTGSTGHFWVPTLTAEMPPACVALPVNVKNDVFAEKMSRKGIRRYNYIRGCIQPMCFRCIFLYVYTTKTCRF